MFPDPFPTRTPESTSTETLPLETEAQESEICTSPTLIAGTVFLLGFSRRGFDSEQEANPRTRKEKKIYFIDTVYYKIDKRKYRNFPP
jgi:hypothetical protein